MDSSRLLHVAVATCLLLAGCDIPTEPPLLIQRWVIPVQETTLSVEELLPPNDVSVSGNNFQLDVDWVSAGETLGNLCPGCINGGPIPAPAFTGSFQSSQSLPADVISAQLSGGSIRIEINNGLSFDPIAGGGTFTISITNGVGGNSVGQLQLDGATDAVPPGNTIRTIDLSAGTVDSDLVATIDVTSVGGQSAVIDVTDRIDISASGPSGPPADIPLLVSSAVVDVTNQSVVLDPATLEQDLDTDITDRILQGTVILEVTNPFGVGLDGTVDIGPTSKPFSIPATATSSVEISYTGAELRSFLELPNPTLTGSGTANGTAITVAPGQVLTLEAVLDFTIEIG